jgi:hypothetical protein
MRSSPSFPHGLLRSMETVGDESVLSEFTMYFLCPGSEDEGWDEKAAIERVALFDTAQKNLIGDFLRSILDRSALHYWHPYAEHGLRWWGASSLGPGDGSSNPSTDEDTRRH